MSYVYERLIKEIAEFIKTNNYPPKSVSVTFDDFRELAFYSKKDLPNFVTVKIIND